MPEIGCEHDDSWTGDANGHWICDVCGADCGKQEFDMLVKRIKSRTAGMEALTVERDEARAALGRITGPHVKYYPTAADDAWKTNAKCEECGHPYPCPTIAALRGDQS